MEWMISHIQLDGLFDDLYQHIHTDENGFFLMKQRQKYYPLPDKKRPVLKAKSKLIFQKIMFLCAVGGPRWDKENGMWFDGKIEIWPFIEKVVAKNNSRNRPKGTLETKDFASVNAEEYKKMMIEKILPAIQAKWS